MIREPRLQQTSSGVEEGLSPHRVLIPLGLGTALSLLGDSTLYTVLPRPSIAASVGVTLTMVGILLGVNRLVRLLSNPLAGWLYDRLPARRIMIAALFIGLTSTLILGFGRGFEIYLVSRVLWGIAWSGIWIGGNSMVLDIADDTNRGQLSGWYQMWFFAGIGTSAFLGGLFTDLFGFFQGLRLSAGLTGFALLLWVLFLPETKPRRVSNMLRPPPKTDSPFPWSIALTASIPVFVVRFVLAGVLASTTILWLGSFLGDGVRIQSRFIPLATFAGGFVAVRTLTGMISAPISGRLSDLLRRRWLVIAVLLTLGSIGLWLMSNLVLALAIVGALLVSIPGGGIQTLAPAIAGDNVEPDVEGRVLSTIYTIGDFASAIGPPLALWLLSRITINSLYNGCAVFLGISALLAFWIEFSKVRKIRGLSSQQ